MAVVPIDFESSAIALQPPDLRKDRLSALLLVLISPVLVLYTNFLNYRNAKLAESFAHTAKELEEIANCIVTEIENLKNSCVFDSNQLDAVFVPENADESIGFIYPQLMVFDGIVPSSYYNYQVEVSPLNAQIIEKYRLLTKNYEIV